MKLTELKQYNYFLYSEIPEEVRERFSERIERDRQQIKLEKTVLSSCPGNVYYRLEDGYYDHAVAIYEHDDFLFTVRTDWKSKKDFLYFHNLETLKYQNIEFRIRDEATKNIKTPNKIGVCTEKKIRSWLNYLAEYKTVMGALLDSHTGKNGEIKKQIDHFVSSIAGAKIYRSETTVDVITKLFEIRLTHNVKSSYLSKEIRFTGDLTEVAKIHNLMDS